MKVSLLIIFSSSAVMINNMRLFAPLCLLLVWMLPVDSMEIHAVALNMVESSVDDMYFDCKETMTQMVENKYFQKENRDRFRDVWEKASHCANNNLNERDPEDQALTKDHMQAICVYTCDYVKFYKTFNDHVRNNRSIYGTKFLYHSLHFWLTSAVQILNENQEKCETTYRRTSLKFTGSVNEVIQFGSFTSSSKTSNLTIFGNKTCFKITTCSGAYLKHYSVIADEEEVLIPPYEIFKISGKKKGGDVAELSDCEDVYVLESTGVHSSLNCRAVN